MTKKIVLDNKEITVAIKEYLSKRDIKLPDTVIFTVGLKKRLPEDLSSNDYIAYVEVEYNE